MERGEVPRLINSTTNTAASGTATLNSGTVTVNTAAVTANSLIFLTAQAGTLNAGELGVSSRTADVSFTITSTNMLDARTVAWMIVRP